MPELPDVEAVRKSLERCCVGKRITDVIAVEQGDGNRENQFDDIVYECEEKQFVEAVKGKVVKSIERKGKNMWMVLDAPPHPGFHFGMTGSFVIKGEKVSRYKSFEVDDSKYPPKFTKCELVFEDGTRAAFVNVRRLGRIRLFGESPESEKPLCELGNDPYLEPYPIETLKEILSKRKIAIKALLLDQGVFAGVGNWVADEVLYQARIHPATKCNELDGSAIQKLSDQMMYVLKTAVECDAESSKFPSTWLFHKRWAKGKEKQKTEDGHSIEFITVGGRTTAYVPELQKNGGHSSSKAKPQGKTDAKGVKRQAAKQSPRNKTIKTDEHSREAKRSNTKEQASASGDRKPNRQSSKNSRAIKREQTPPTRRSTRKRQRI